MKIESLHMHAFGGFSDKSLHFSTKSPGLHIIFGHNEAGKSTTLRALKYLLYGFPERITDNYLHTNDRLILGGTLLNDAGNSLSFRRKKRRKNDILDQFDSPISHSVLTSYLAGIDAELFEQIYWLNHESLVLGGQEILQQKGEVGLALFSAATGLQGVKGIFSQLEDEAVLLFNARGMKPKINAAISEYKKLEKKVREVSLSGRKYQKMQDSLQADEKALALLEKERNALQMQKQNLELIFRIAPQIQLRNKLLKENDNLSEVRLLPENFSQQRVQLEKDQYAAKEKLIAAKKRLKNLLQKREVTSFSSKVIDNEKEIISLSYGLGAFKKGKVDKPKLDGMRIECRREASEALRGFGATVTLENITDFFPFLLRKKSVVTLVNQHESLREKKADIEQKITQTEIELSAYEQERQKIGTNRDFGPLKNAITAARKVGDIDFRVQQLSKKITERKEHLKSWLKQSGVWLDQLESLYDMTLPMKERVESFEKRYAENQHDHRQCNQENLQEIKRLKKNQAELERVKVAGEVPSENDLIAIRQKRDDNWFSLKKGFEGKNKEDVHQEYTLHDTCMNDFEKLIHQADEYADLLRKEQERVHRVAMLAIDINESEQIIAHKKELIRQNEVDRQLLDKSWQDLWQGIPVSLLSPSEMFHWLSDVSQIRKDLRELWRWQEDKKILQDTIGFHVSVLRQTIDHMPEEVNFSCLEPLLFHAETELEKREQAETLFHKNIVQINEKKKRVQLLESEHSELINQERHWHSCWQKLTGTLPEGYIPRPEEAIEFVDCLQKGYSKEREGQDFQKRMDGIQHDMDVFQQQAATVIAKISNDFLSLPLEESIRQLNELLAQAKKRQATQEQYDQEIGECQNEVEAIEQTLLHLEKQHARLCEIAGCGKQRSLLQVEQLSLQYAASQKRIAEIDEQLLREGGGRSFEELEQLTENVDIENHSYTIEQCSLRLEQVIHPQMKKLSENIGEKKAELLRDVNRSDAAELVQEKERLSARIERLVERYVVLKGAAHLLKKEIDRYRLKNQDPLLALASNYFMNLTEGSFDKLLVDEDSRGNQIIVGDRQGAPIPVEFMSSGTRDQLYLSLRLAYLKWQIEERESMPFIIDDILINFDDHRAAAALQVFLEFSRSIQVLVFTHHHQVVEVAKSLVEKEHVMVHEL